MNFRLRRVSDGFANDSVDVDVDDLVVRAGGPPHFYSCQLVLRWRRDHKRPFFARVFCRARFSCEFSGKFSDKPPDKFSGGPKAASWRTKKTCENVSSQLSAVVGLVYHAGRRLI